MIVISKVEGERLLSLSVPQLVSEQQAFKENTIIALGGHNQLIFDAAFKGRGSFVCLFVFKNYISASDMSLRRETLDISLKRQGPDDSTTILLIWKRKRQKYRQCSRE